MTEKINPNTCPFCNKSNQCAVTNQHGCWCNKIEIPIELIKLIPETLIDKSCICNACINSFIYDNENFLNKLVNIETSLFNDLLK